MRARLGFNDDFKEADYNRVILKMGINVDDGFVYFNEMLYRIMRAQYVINKNMRLNKVLAVTEVITQFKIAEITLNNKGVINKIKLDDLEKSFFTTLEAQPVNLFLTKMFWKTSFRAWRKYTEIVV